MGLERKEKKGLIDDKLPHLKRHVRSEHSDASNNMTES